MAVRHLQENNLNLLFFTSLNFQSWLSFFRRPDLSNRVVRSTRPFLVVILILMAVLGTYTNRFSLFSKHFTRRRNAWLSSLPLLTQQIFLVYWFDIKHKYFLNLPTYFRYFYSAVSWFHIVAPLILGLTGYTIIIRISIIITIRYHQLTMMKVRCGQRIGLVGSSQHKADNCSVSWNCDAKRWHCCTCPPGD